MAEHYLFNFLWKKVNNEIKNLNTLKEFCRWRFTTNNSSNKIQKFLRNHRGASSHCCVMSYVIDHQFLIINDHTKNVYFPVQVWKIQFFFENFFVKCAASSKTGLCHCRSLNVCSEKERRHNNKSWWYGDFFADARHMYARQFSWWFFLLLLIENFARIS